MNTNNLPFIEQATRTAISIVEQIQSWPSSVLLGVVLIIIGGVLKTLALFPNKFIPVTLLVVGSSANVFIGDPGKVSPEQRYPDVILGMWGFCVAFAAWMAHAVVLKRFEKYIPILNGRSGNTEIVAKPTSHENGD